MNPLLLQRAGAVIEEDERRRYQRYSLKEVTFVVFRPEFRKLGTIRDIGEGGIAFDYFDYGQSDWEAYSTMKELPQEVDLFLKESRFYMSCVPCRIAHEGIGNHNDDSGAFDSPVKYCGLEFGTLTDKQKEQLKYFLRNHTAETDDQGEPA